MARESNREPEGPGSLRREFVDLPGQLRQRSDQDIRKDVESLLFYDKLVSSYKIQIAVDRGVVTLSGTVGSEGEKHKAIEDTQKVHGIRQVVDQLEISQEAS